MPVLKYNGLSWFQPLDTPSRGVLSEEGYAFEAAFTRDAEVVQTPFFVGPRLLAPTSNSGGDRIGVYCAPETIGTDACVGFIVGGDYVQAEDALGFVVTATVGSGFDRRANGVGFVRYANGTFALRAKNGSGGDEGAFSTAAALPAGVWRDDLANTVYIKKTDDLYELFVNDHGPVVSTTASVSVNGVGAMCWASTGAVTFPFSLPIITTEEEGALSFRLYRPAEDGASDFTPDTGTDGFSRINEDVPDGDTSYVEASDDLATAFFTYRDAQGNPIEIQTQQTVHGVKHYMQARTSDADTRRLRIVVTDGVAVEGAGAGNASPAYVERQIALTSNPLTGVAWQPEDFEGIQFGFQIDDEVV